MKNQIKAGQTWFDKMYANKTAVVVKALFDDQVVIEFPKRAYDEKYGVYSIESFKESFAPDFEALQRQRLERDIERKKEFVESKRRELSELENELKKLNEVSNV